MNLQEGVVRTLVINGQEPNVLANTVNSVSLGMMVAEGGGVGVMDLEFLVLWNI